MAGARRLARDLRQGDGRRRPRAADADLARREVLRVHAGDRAPVRQQPPAQRRGPVRVLRSRRRLPEADAGWIGEAGPGPSYLDDGSGGPGNDFTNRNATFMTWNLLHLARMLKDAGGIPAHGNQRTEWDAGCRFDFPNPEHR